jgi:hypothetical protein
LREKQEEGEGEGEEGEGEGERKTEGKDMALIKAMHSMQ